MLISMLKMQIFRQNSLIDTHFTQIRRYYSSFHLRIILADFNKLVGYLEIDTNVYISIRYFSINFMKLICENIYDFVRWEFFGFEKFTSNFENILIIKFREFFFYYQFFTIKFFYYQFFYHQIVFLNQKEISYNQIDIFHPQRRITCEYFVRLICYSG